MQLLPTLVVAILLCLLTALAVEERAFEIPWGRMNKRRFKRDLGAEVEEPKYDLVRGGWKRSKWTEISIA